MEDSNKFFAQPDGSVTTTPPATDEVAKTETTEETAAGTETPDSGDTGTVTEKPAEDEAKPEGDDAPEKEEAAA